MRATDCLAIGLSLALAGCMASPETLPPPAPLPPAIEPAPGLAVQPDPTRILDRGAADRLRRNKGLTLQWIDWQQRGTARITVDSRGVWRLRGEQSRGAARIILDGVVTEIGRDYFTFDGQIAINDAPDAGRACLADKTWHFAVTQKRPYWRLREFEWCDELTDYIDIYF